GKRRRRYRHQQDQRQVLRNGTFAEPPPEGHGVKGQPAQRRTGKTRMNNDSNAEPESSGQSRTPVKRQIKRGLWALALVLVLVFILQNFRSFPLQYFFWGFTWPLALLIIITLAVGMLLGWGLTRFARRRRRNRP